MDNNQEKIKIITNLDENDIYNLNIYVLNMTKNITSIIFGVVFIVWSIWDIIIYKQEKLLLNIIVCLIGFLFITYSLFLFKFLRRKKLNKITFSKMEPLEVILSKDGILYQYEKENEQNYTPYSWNLINKVCETNKYIFIHLIDKKTILQIKKSDILDEKFTEYIKGNISISKYKYIKNDEL